MKLRTILLALAAVLTFSLAAPAQTNRKKPGVKATPKPITVTLVRWPYT
ncbi:MAG: hypothetical protein HYR56_28695 [Acidobacteria bacterium]|nr:hypothetical protein [Acidobacteriota bacterium]MBI3424035.1 hypothetical protein [Acidobacteriota bacterium]